MTRADRLLIEISRFILQFIDFVRNSKDSTVAMSVVFMHAAD